MKLSTLYEARDPKREAELEPALTAPFRKPEDRKKTVEKTAQAYRQEYGMPERQFLPEPKGGPWTVGSLGNDELLMPGPVFRDIGNARLMPTQRYSHGKILPDSNVSTGKELNNAISYWSKNFGGERWPVLEKAFLNRDWTFKGGVGMYTSARTSLFKYLNNLKQSWPEGEKMANQVLESSNGLRYFGHPEIRKYVQSKPPMPGLIQNFKQAIHKYNQDIQKWKTVEYPKWEEDVKKWQEAQAAKNSIATSFHDDDEFNRSGGPPMKPLEPSYPFRKEDNEWVLNYIKSSEHP